MLCKNDSWMRVCWDNVFTIPTYYSLSHAASIEYNYHLHTSCFFLYPLSFSYTLRRTTRVILCQKDFSESVLYADPDYYSVSLGHTLHTCDATPVVWAYYCFFLHPLSFDTYNTHALRNKRGSHRINQNKTSSLRLSIWSMNWARHVVMSRRVAAVHSVLTEAKSTPT